MRRLLLAAVLVLAAVPAFATDITRDAVVAAMNSYRAKHGLPPLRVDDRLHAAADDRMKDMEEQAYWAHVSPDGRSPFQCLEPRGYKFGFAGENLATGFETAEILLESWMESPGHRDNILSANYMDCGVAVIDGSTLGRATGKSVVVLFATPLSAIPPTTVHAKRR